MLNQTKKEGPNNPGSGHPSAGSSFLAGSFLVSVLNYFAKTRRGSDAPPPKEPSDALVKENSPLDPSHGFGVLRSPEEALDAVVDDEQSAMTAGQRSQGASLLQAASVIEGLTV